MGRTGLTRLDVKRARDALIARLQHPSIDAVRIALGNTGSKSTIHRYLKELEEESGVTYARAESVSRPIKTLIEQLSAQLHEEARAVVDAQAVEAAIERREAELERAKLIEEIAELRAQLADAAATLAREQTAHAETSKTMLAGTLDIERLTQQVRGLNERVAEQEGFRQSLEEKLVHARDALEHFRTAAREQREQETRRHEQQISQLQAELRQANQTGIIKQNEITQLNKDNARLVAESGATAKQLREMQALAERVQTTLGQALADRARVETERTALEERMKLETVELRQLRDVNAKRTTECTELTAQLAAHRTLIEDYRQRLALNRKQPDGEQKD